jgi:hypothetical protein
MATDAPINITAQQQSSLRRWNIIAGFAHATQAVLILVLSSDFSLPVTSTYILGPPGTTASETVTLFDSPIALGVALFFALSAFFHFFVATIGFRRYIGGLSEQRNIARWVEYSISSSIMIVLILQITGITDAWALLAVFGVNASMILFGWLQEKYEVPGKGGWLPFIFGCIAGIVPWIIVVFQLIRPGATGQAEVPAFVWGIVISLFIFFNIFALNQWLQYKRVGRWSNYLYGEKWYIILSLVAKSLLAWQVFAGTLVPPA